MTPATQQRNGEIELARFFAALVIVNLHASFFLGCPSLFRNGQIGVEFFFLLSGFLMASSIQRKGSQPCPSWRELNRETVRFLWRKFSSFYPELLISCLVGLIFFGCAYHAEPIAVAGMWVRTFTANILLLETSGFAGRGLGINGVSWYLASMMWGMAILYPLYRRFGLNTILPALSFVVLSVFFAGSGLGEKMTDLGFLLRRENIRGFCELVCGAALFPLAMRLRQFAFRPWLRLLLLLVKLACYAIVLKDAIGKISPHFGGSGLVLFALMGIIVLSFSKVCPDANIYQHRWIFWLGRFSLPLFLSHVFYIHLGHVVPDHVSAVSRFFLFHGCAFATALLVMYLAHLVRRFLREHPNFFLNSSAER